MPKRSKNNLINKLREQRNEKIRIRFEALYNTGLRYEIVIETLINEFILSENTISQIIKKQGIYKTS